jgi:adenylate cyclase class 1
MTLNAPLPDRSSIERWQNSFLSLNAQRLQAARKQLSSRQQIVLDVLPLLLHANSSRLPGYLAPDTPCGIAGFTPDRDHHTALHQVARGAQLPREPGQRNILGVYLMGSLGSIAQSRSSDLDVWVCHDELLTDFQLEALQEKCRRIEHWANTQGTEVHFFLMNLKDFRTGQSRSADGEDCGSSQHLLLLDEFYRSGLWIAGKKPRWWIIPEDSEAVAESCWQELVNNHSVDINDWLDVGSLGTIPAGEFVGAGLWQLNKGLDNPYKSLLKLLLTCEYASQYPHIRPLAWDLKKQVHSGEATPENTDAYLLMLARIEKQLDSTDSEQLDLIRRSFYFKTGIKLTQLAGSQRDQWRTKALENQITTWGWSHTLLAELDNREQWLAIDVLKERNALVTQMLNSYRTLITFSEQHANDVHISQEDMTVLGNRLYAAFKSEPGKTIDINPGIRTNMTEEKITLNLTDDGWQLIPGNWRPGDTRGVLHQSSSLVEILLFAHRNGLLTSESHIALYPTHNPVTQYELRALVQDILQIAPPNKKSCDFTVDKHATSWHLFINSGVNPQQALSRRGMQKISNRDDALGFSSSRENLVQTIELVTVSNWGEWQVDHFVGETAIHQAILKILNYRSNALSNHWPDWQVHCHCQVRAVAIKSRVEQLTRDLILHMSQPKPSPYLLQTGESFHLLEYRRGEVVSHGADNHTELVKMLARPRRRFRRWQLDRHALPVSPLRLILEQSQGEQWQLWYWRQKQKIFVYVMDDCGSLYYQQLPDRDIRATLVPILRLINTLNRRWALERQQEPWPFILTELKMDPESYAFSEEKRRMPDEAEQTSSLEVTASITDDSAIVMTVQNQTLSQQEFGSGVFAKARNAILAIRSNNANQPIWLNDIALYSNQHLTKHLQYRRKLERVLNHPATGQKTAS